MMRNYVALYSLDSLSDLLMTLTTIQIPVVEVMADFIRLRLP